MKAAVINEINGRFDVEEVSIGDPVGREVLVQVKAAGLCHSDLLVASIDRGRPLPMVVGHEMAGIVAAVGPDVRDLAVGDHVVGSEVKFCGHCEECLAGHSYRCVNPGEISRPRAAGSKLRRSSGDVHAFGVAAFAEYTICHANSLVRIPRELPFPQAAVLSCAAITGVGAALNTAKVQPGDTVAVIGLGGIGLNILSGARIAGATTIIGVDVHPAKLELATRFGATHVANSSTEDAVARVREISGRGVHHSFEAIGLGATQAQAIEMTRVGGGAYFIGIPQGAPLEVDVLRSLIASQRRIQGVYMGSSNIRRDIPMYAELYLQGRLNLDDLVAQEIPLEGINDAYRLQESGAIARSVITSF
ncbi:S-(hydroxymethyl)glutathione dehydrogenase/alcohol dehydrogenase [Pseudarthrobacter oxydans]|uniref:Zn-dependent alcohol dehydrogenase n=1 Tax=Pseudarthrobacter oxydans TaxID=1671 RepID=UPI00278B6637|nr:Zn-dependent alcohol dehydrogenase [Pseudarthrobacter oxydans]MDP9984585.1 S-(hydroxymethyl)glutathione dehydrogenase/alcohol dehydrogenase [Pseudarthrobacter oxydans]